MLVWAKLCEQILVKLKKKYGNALYLMLFQYPHFWQVSKFSCLFLDLL